MPDRVDPVRAQPRERLPRRREAYAYEFAWGGRRLIVFADHGTARAQGASGKAPAGLAEALGAHRTVLDGELTDVGYLVFDLLYLDGRSLLDEPYTERRDALAGLDLAGPRWQTAPWFDDGDAVRQAARDQGLPGVVAKRLDRPYRQASADWRLIAV